MKSKLFKHMSLPEMYSLDVDKDNKIYFEVSKIKQLAIIIKHKDGTAAASNKSSDADIYAVVAKVSKLNGLKIKVIGNSLTISNETSIITNKREFLK